MYSQTDLQGHHHMSSALKWVTNLFFVPQNYLTVSLSQEFILSKRLALVRREMTPSEGGGSNSFAKLAISKIEEQFWVFQNFYNLGMKSDQWSDVVGKCTQEFMHDGDE